MDSVASTLRHLRRHQRAAHRRVLGLQREGRDAVNSGVGLGSEQLACIGYALKEAKRDFRVLMVQLAYWRRRAHEREW